ncbi:hypothetical protein CLCAR_1687 [Clostridium carboxidivorans P7]|uniref:hypothetical protein n=1 Tax=Clostridium carboxidivorans TaxID=217159 RepID=UPI0001D392B2|nr:hypothetical protein [Clostridium carboxidivorans]EFG88937.1 hypothetical protein CLCAR_1687 [Clostridium carboxidivorans P7]
MINNFHTLNPLDKVRLNNGTNGLNNFFNKSFQNNTKESISLINNQNLNFASLFILKAKIEELNIFNSLNLRNKIALEITYEICTGKKSFRNNEYLCSDYIQGVNSVLKWMLTTGSIDDGMNNEFDEVLDASAILLTKIYRDKTILPLIAEMIFKRHKQKSLIHNLVWAFFECGDPKSLILIGERLQSQDPKDVELSKKLLNFIPGINIFKHTDKNNYYLYFLNWFEKNFLFLHFTGESFQQCSNPIPYEVILEAKYLCTAVSTNTGKILKPLKKEEIELLKIFNKLDYNTKLLLANFSFNLHHKNIHNWNKWLWYPMSEQIKIARIGGF